MFGLSEDQFATILKVLNQESVEEAWVFGSRAKGSYKAGSDVDLAIVGDAQKIAYLLNEETLLPYFFDVLNLRELNNQNLKDHIARVGVRIL